VVHSFYSGILSSSERIAPDQLYGFQITVQYYILFAQKTETDISGLQMSNCPEAIQKAKIHGPSGRIIATSTVEKEGKRKWKRG
jgi:hypothetical protein